MRYVGESASGITTLRSSVVLLAQFRDSSDEFEPKTTLLSIRSVRFVLTYVVDAMQHAA